MRPFTSVLIANRGEIAVRILRSAQRLGYRVIAVYSDADATAMHVRLADQAVHIGPPAPRDSYLNGTTILAAAKASGAQAIHPGYGFLAENADFAQAVVDAGLVWIGPPAAAIRAMGDKAQARQLMQVAQVPCVPGYDGELQDDAWLRAQADQVGFPLMIKATAGGGGRGMRLVDSAADFDAALASARSEALSAFGSSTVLLERAIVRPRHVEIQVFADDHGHVVHLGERDCSVQRRHQKVIEEAPCPAFSGAQGQRLRRRMGEMAVAAARAINYRGAGTIECLLDDQGQFYFMEMNTRLQVEHPVTEALTGFDLVEWQLRVAQGEVLPETSQDAILERFESGGHAIEARLCAEDPGNSFLPQSGLLLDWRPGSGLRIDHALEPGTQIPPYYDSMLAKFVAHGADRAAAVARLAQGLRAATVLGVRTNQAFLVACLEHPDFGAGAATTAFIPTLRPELLAATPPMRPSLAALVLYAARAAGCGHDPQQVALPLAWPIPMRFGLDGASHAAHVQALGANRYQVGSGGSVEVFDIVSCAPHAMVLRSATGRESIALALCHDTLFASQGGRQTCIEDRTLASASVVGTNGAGLVRAPMAGRIVAVHVSIGQTVAKGAPLVVLEAMKMEHPSFAPFDGTVTAVAILQGAQVSAGTLLVELLATL